METGFFISKKKVYLGMRSASRTLNKDSLCQENGSFASASRIENRPLPNQESSLRISTQY